MPGAVRPGGGRTVTGPGLLQFDPILVPKPWGGTRLASLDKQPAPRQVPGTRYGESWEVADLPRGALSAAERGRTRVAAGPQRGKTLRRLIAEQGAGLLGSASPTPAGDFPLLFKLLDTAEHLSIQVHPDETWTARNPRWLPKTESWYVLDAEPGAAIFKGFRSGVGIGDVRAAAGTPALAGLLRRIPVRRGEFHHLPSGTVHALGAGVTVAEVQTPSDTTFRLYDWTDEYDRPPRPLQIRRALDTLRSVSPAGLSRGPMSDDGSRMLVETPNYWLREHRETDRPIVLQSAPELRILAVAQGRAHVTADDGSSVELEAGGVVVASAEVATSTRVSARGISTLVEVGLC
ncbi:MAG: class I mannose-6-phosphate isomerase [bacterium]|nr:class I mannose-6-phosphate isomerase [bacterium]